MNATRAQVRAALEGVRRRTHALVDRLEDEDLERQYVDFLSPMIWDLGHIANFEELWLLRRIDGRPGADDKLDHLYNAFENPRWTRGDLPLLDRAAAARYLADVRAEALALLDRTPLDGELPLAEDAYVHRMIAQHEGQHQETMLQLLGLRREVDLPLAHERDLLVTSVRHVDDEERVHVPGGPFVLGTDDRRWTYDNERPAHVVDLPAFWMDRFPVTNRRYAAFIADGGYDRDELWSQRGWQWRHEHGHAAPQGWEPGDGGWRLRRFGRLVELDPAEPVQHVSWFEAEAFAAWAGGRQPTELEWEKAAGWEPATASKRRFPWGDDPPTTRRANVGQVRFHPAPVGSLPAGASAYGIEQLAGDVYEWTSSPFEGWPGFEAFPYPEYSEVFFGGQDYRVLRGSSWAISSPMARVTYRNWDHPYRRQVLAGIRVAWDAS
ncbi:MAG: ergothioneine biosynthesis protein EgtB [Nitriliruptorales bacterium]|nr:ergothioneine biosynthesis protein EgtB [Nitriliruptorales bacterium]